MTFRMLFSPLIAASLLSGCATGSIMGLPKPEFHRTFLAGINVGGAEHCGRPVNAELVKQNLASHQTKRGIPASEVEQSSKVFEQMRSEYKQRISRQADFCTKEYKPELSRINLYERGDFPDVE